MGHERLSMLRRRWRRQSLLYCVLVAVTVVLPAVAVLHVWLGWSLWVGAVLFVLVLGIVLWLVPVWRMGLADVSVFLDRSVPELEDSCGLLLRPFGELNGLERLQAARLEERLGRVVMPRPFWGRLLRACGWLGLAVIVSVGLSMVRGPRVAVSTGGLAPVVAGVATVVSTETRITPPAYTGKRLYTQEGLNLQVEEGAQVEWSVRVSRRVDSVNFLFNDSVSWALRSKDGMVWRLGRTVTRPGFYQVRLGGSLSPLYKLELIKDEPPKIVIRMPRAYTMIDYGQPEQVSVKGAITDDYGVDSASIVITLASGKGEAVKFKEQEVRLGSSFLGRRVDVSRVLDLPALGVKPGDELYFYCKARDNHGQETRTETYIISVADTAQLMSLSGMTMATDVKPEFFRSERQIIIETEELLRQRDTLAVPVFNNRSNELGIDQKLLRLRYGKFLGEEAEEGEGIADTASMGAFGDATKMLDAFTDKHDNAEDATYFEPAVKQQLKATLSEMWGAELRFRTLKPKEALPFCYKALRLLKDLQQQSRAYVAKTGVRLTPLNPGKRLTGELTGIAAPKQRVSRFVGLSEEDELRMGLAVMEELRVGGVPGMAGREVLLSVERKLGAAAAVLPGRYLDAYAEIRKIVEGKYGDPGMVERAVSALLPEAKAEPVVRPGAVDGGLSRLYFSYLK